MRIFLNAINNIRHAEERSPFETPPAAAPQDEGSASRSTQNANAALIRGCLIQAIIGEVLCRKE